MERNKMNNEIMLSDVLGVMFDANTATLWADVATADVASRELIDIEQDLAASKLARYNTETEIKNIARQRPSWGIKRGKSMWDDHIVMQEFIRGNMRHACVNGFRAMAQLRQTHDFAKNYDIVLGLNTLVRRYNSLVRRENKNPELATKLRGIQNKIATCQLNILVAERDRLFKQSGAGNRLVDVQNKILALQQGNFIHKR